MNTKLSKSLSEELSYMIQWSFIYQWGRRCLWPLKCLTDVTFQLQLVLTICIQYIQKPCWWLPAFTAHSNHNGLKKQFLDIHFAQRHCASNHIRIHTRSTVLSKHSSHWNWCDFPKPLSIHWHRLIAHSIIKHTPRFWTWKRLQQICASWRVVCWESRQQSKWMPVCASDS